jgi:flagellar L-ring protein precursor FlgH
MRAHTHFITRVSTIGLLALALGLSGCATAPEPLAHTPEFAPVIPVAVEKPRMATGAIYNGRHSDNFFGRSRNYRVGDLITVMLDESTRAGREQKGSVSRDAENNVVPSGLVSKIMRLPDKLLGNKFDGALNGVNLNKSTIKSDGVGTAGQSASLSGAVSVTVVEVLSNGNLMVRGEKQLALTEGAEIIQVSGIIRPDDVSPNNMVQSRRLANAQISYRGTGDMAAVAKTGWGTKALLKVWPF